MAQRPPYLARALGYDPLNLKSFVLKLLTFVLAHDLILLTKEAT
jgi:hypothetical protein